MKKFFACVVILAIFSSVVFYFGWTQFRVKPQQVGIVISKTDGIDETPVTNGTFSWHKEFLIPTNAELKLFSIKPVNLTKTVKGQLPSGNVYTAVYNSSDNFDYFLSFSMSLTVSPEALVKLIKENKVTDNDDLSAYLEKSGDVLAQLAADYYLKKARENENFRPESVRRDDLLKAIQFYKDCPEIELSIFALLESKIPDYTLYKKMQSAGVEAEVAE